MAEQRTLRTEADTAALGAELATKLCVGTIILLSGPLGAGKTTLTRAILRHLGWHGAVRSPTYNLIHTYPTTPPVMHADLYRVDSADGIGLEEFFDTHLCLIEWPDRLRGLLDGCPDVVRIELDFAEEGRIATLP